LEQWSRLAEIADHLVTSLAILVGGMWAYLKFVRGRTFAHRAELEVSGALFGHGGDRIVRATVRVKNTGLSKLPLKPDGKVVYLHGISATGWAPEGNVEWEKLAITPVLGGLAWIEAHESVSDEALIPVPARDRGDARWLALRLEAQVWGRRRSGRGGPRWMAATIVPVEITPLTGPE
jgi:hypothetical protein